MGDSWKPSRHTPKPLTSDTRRGLYSPPDPGGQTRTKKPYSAT